MLLTLPFLVQGIVITLDEFIFHIKRELPKWERIGHPLDTLTVLLCILFVLFFPYSALNLKIFVALSVFSALFVTKDEFVHKHHCPASEQWLHALLFLNHPVLLTSMGLIWAHPTPFFILFLKIQAGLVTLFGLYQVVYWNILYGKRIAHQ